MSSGRVLYLVAAIGALFVALWTFPADDALRHVGIAFGGGRLWGEVYPFSIFEQYATCRPWGGFDAALHGAALGIEQLPVSPLAQRFAALKLVVFGLVAAHLGLAVWRSGLVDEVGSARDLGIAVALAVVVLWLPILRTSYGRPFVLGTLAVLYAVGARGFVGGALATSVVGLAYPYLAWMYAGPMVVAHGLRGCRRFALGAFVGAAVTLALTPRSCWSLVVDLVRSDGVRGELDLSIAEFAAAWDQPAIPIALAVAFAVLWRRLPPEARKVRPVHIMMLLFLPISLKYLRYFVDVQLTLFFAAHARDALRMLRGPADRLLARLPASGSSEPLSPVVRVVLGLGYGVVLLALGLGSLKELTSMERTASALEQVPEGSLVVTEFNLQYSLLLARPDLRLVPSCELGFPRAEIKEPYVGYVNDGRVCALATAVQATHFVEARRVYLDPLDTACLELVAEDPTLRIWRVRS